MKTTLLCLALALPAFAEEANPFVTGPEKTAPVEAGEPFASLVEYVVVPAEVLDDWLDAHPLKDDAKELRAVVQQWIHEGKATLDQTSVTVGTSGFISINQSCREPIHATEYEPSDPGEWPMPSAFATRNVGYTFEGTATTEQGKPTLLGRMEFVRILPQLPFHPLVDATCLPGDVFIPRYRSISVSQTNGEEARGDSDPFAPSSDPDPFAKTSDAVRFSPGSVHLAARTNELLPMPRIQSEPLPEAAAEDDAALLADRPVRLIFFRGVVEPFPDAPRPVPGEESQISVRLVKVDHRVFSDWLQTADLSTIQGAAAGVTDEWRKEGKAKILSELSARNRMGSSTHLDSVAEVTYPTEWEPGVLAPAVDGKPAQREFATGTSFETRNVGLSAETRIVQDSDWPFVRVKVNSVEHGGNTVHHRIFRDGKWQVNATFPLFSSGGLQSNLLLTPGQWMLAGSNAAIDVTGQFDPDHAVLVFVKVE